MAKKRTLDRTRPYGRIFGGGEAVFEQFGIKFDGAGEELPGFEDVEIPPAPVAVAADEAGLRAQVKELLAQNERLQTEIGKVRDAQADAEALAEELMGKLDTANIEIARLQAQFEELSKPADPAAGNPGTAAPVTGGKGKKAAAEQSSLLDEQLAAQTGAVS